MPIRSMLNLVLMQPLGNTLLVNTFRPVHSQGSLFFQRFAATNYTSTYTGYIFCNALNLFRFSFFFIKFNLSNFNCRFQLTQPAPVSLCWCHLQPTITLTYTVHSLPYYLNIKLCTFFFLVTKSKPNTPRTPQRLINNILIESKEAIYVQKKNSE